MVSGTVNVDGTGLAWWQGDEPEPLRYVFDGPPWADPNLRHLTSRLVSGHQVGVVRSATPGIGFGIAHVQPFVDERSRIAFAHNGWIGGFRGALGQELLAGLHPSEFSLIPALNDTAALFRAVTQRISDGIPADTAVIETLAEVVRLCNIHNEAASLNVLLARADFTLAVRCSYGVEPNSLYFSSQDRGLLVASEPLDTTQPWETIPPNSIIELQDGGANVSPLPPFREANSGN